jgi:hypothetical protein
VRELTGVRKYGGRGFEEQIVGKVILDEWGLMR